MDARTFKAVTKLIDPGDLYLYRTGERITAATQIIVYCCSGEAGTPWIVATHDGLCIARIWSMHRTIEEALAARLELLDTGSADYADEPGYAEASYKI